MKIRKAFKVHSELKTVEILKSEKILVVIIKKSNSNKHVLLLCARAPRDLGRKQPYINNG